MEKTMQEMQKEEAVKRLQELRIPEKIIQDFEENGTVRLSLTPFGIFDELTPALEAEIKQFEEKYEALVFFVIRDDVHFDKLDSLLFVSKYQEEWEDDHCDIADGYVMTYTINHVHPFCSEFGSIAYGRTDFGGLFRRG